jgi:hypothetical protein
VPDSHSLSQLSSRPPPPLYTSQLGLSATRLTMNGC